ncbi:hypothetical protein K439DRAFT_1617747 [Ramaria rubella]|nr:hypothetical protein K439DRAFT_1617747 [Ramaria rubella]
MLRRRRAATAYLKKADPQRSIRRTWSGPMLQVTERLLDPQSIVHLVASKYYMLASIVVLYFDHFLTFDLEVNSLWKPALGATVLFLVNRYYPLIVYAVLLFSVHHPSWTIEACEAFKLFPPVAAVINDALLGSARFRSLFPFAHSCETSGVLFALVPFYISQLVFGGLYLTLLHIQWAASSIVRDTGLPPGSGCITAVPNELVYRFAWLWGTAAIFDTIVFLLTMIRTVRLRKSGPCAPITQIFLRDVLILKPWSQGYVFCEVAVVLFWTEVTANLVTLNWTFNSVYVGYPALNSCSIIDNSFFCASELLWSW